MASDVDGLLQLTWKVIEVFPGCSKNTGKSCKNCTQSTGLLDAKSANKCCASFARTRVRNSVVLGEAGIAETRRNKRTAQLEKTDAGQAGVCDTRASSYVMMAGPWRTCAIKCCPWRVMAPVNSSFTPATIRCKCFERSLDLLANVSHPTANNQTNCSELDAKHA